VLITNIILKFNTGFYKEGIFIDERRKIAKDYFYGMFFWDIIGKKLL
jgi:hypothetical protein